MTNKTKEFLKKIASNDYITEDELVKTADGLLKEEMKEEVLELFERRLKDPEVKETLNNNDKVRFIQAFRYYEEHTKYLKENFDDLDFIIAILKEELEKENENE